MSEFEEYELSEPEKQLVILLKEDDKRTLVELSQELEKDIDWVNQTQKNLYEKGVLEKYTDQKGFTRYTVETEIQSEYSFMEYLEYLRGEENLEPEVAEYIDGEIDNIMEENDVKYDNLAPLADIAEFLYKESIDSI